MALERLTRSEFSAAIRRGQGRALMHVNQYGLTEFANIVLESCLKDPAYDRQCEDSRASWLLSMFQGSKEYPWFASEIMSALERTTESYDLEHLCELAAHMAKGEDQSAGSALRSRVLGQSFAASDTQHGCRALVSLDGVDAIVELARRYGAQPIEKPEDTWPMLGYLTDGADILPLVETRLQTLAQTDSAIKTFLEYEKYHASQASLAANEPSASRAERIQERIRRELPIEKILNDALAGAGTYPGQYMRFGRYASQEQLHVIFQRLLSEADEKVYLRLLWVFRRASLPELHPRIWEFAESKNNDIRASAIVALAQNRNAKIGEFGRAKLCSSAFSENDSEVLELFIRNYQPQDDALILAALRRLSPNDDNAHGIGLNILAICDENDSLVFSELMRWVYETTPCTVCRHSAVKWMVSSENATPEIIFECLHDANEEIRQLGEQRH